VLVDVIESLSSAVPMGHDLSLFDKRLVISQHKILYHSTNDFA